MNIDIIFRLAGIGLVIAIVSQVLKKVDRDEIATLTTLAGLVIVLAMVMEMVSQLFTSLKTMFELY